MFVNAGPLFERAKAAYARAKAKSSSDRELGQMDALDAIVFSVVALEGFINEAGELAAHSSSAGSAGYSPIAVFAKLMDEVERSRGGLELKFMLARQVFTGEMYDRGQLPFQDFALLVDLRNALVHYRSLESFSTNESGVLTFTPAKIIARLRAKHIVAEQDPDAIASWLLVVATVAAARWSCRCASAMVQSLLNVLPESSFKEKMEFCYREPFQAPE